MKWLISLAALALIISSMPEKQPATPDQVQKPEVLIFTATWCRPCKQQVPALKADYESRGYTVTLIDVDQHPDLAKEYGVTELPSVRERKAGLLVPPRVAYRIAMLPAKIIYRTLTILR